MPRIICLDLEGVLVPEVWIAFAEATGIPELRRTTRDEPDYDKLMQGRLAILAQHNLTLKSIQDVIGTLRPLDGAKAFLDALREQEQVVILSDTFLQFAKPLMRQLGFPTIFCHELVIDDADRVVNYRLRLPDSKRQAVRHFRELGYTVHAAGDSYNDTTMLSAADRGVLFRCPDNVAAEFPQFPRTQGYDELWRALVN
ncbi:MAG TPA: bifunctional phosphoserine phosphatase/homoserine phosphotransferase ThrH [Polyangiaceae bacterium]|nr:bifunctional phosphoserine phosphatase/homoserine phosphotransferase ThrH [Polyangiaceae bacterium]